MGRGIGFLVEMAYIKLFKRNVVFMFRRVVNRHPEKTMFINASTGKKWTYKEV